MTSGVEKNIDVFNGFSLFDCREEEFQALANYYIDVYSGKKVKDPIFRMFLDNTMERKAKKYALFVQFIITAFDGKITK